MRTLVPLTLGPVARVRLGQRGSTSQKEKVQVLLGRINLITVSDSQFILFPYCVHSMCLRTERPPLRFSVTGRTFLFHFQKAHLGLTRLLCYLEQGSSLPPRSPARNCPSSCDGRTSSTSRPMAPRPSRDKTHGSTPQNHTHVKPRTSYYAP
jgi:hypothetical protein